MPVLASRVVGYSTSILGRAALIPPCPLLFCGHLPVDLCCWWVGSDVQPACVHARVMRTRAPALIAGGACGTPAAAACKCQPHGWVACAQLRCTGAGVSSWQSPGGITNPTFPQNSTDRCRKTSLSKASRTYHSAHTLTWFDCTCISNKGRQQSGMQRTTAGL